MNIRMQNRNRERHYANRALERYEKARALHNSTENEDIKKRTRRLAIRAYCDYLKHKNAGI